MTQHTQRQAGHPRKALLAQPTDRERANDAFEDGLTGLLASVTAEFGAARTNGSAAS